MSFLRFLLFIYLIVGFAPIFRFKGHHFFYFLYATALFDPIMLIIAHLFHYIFHPSIFHELFLLVCILTFPLINIKLKISLSILITIPLLHFEQTMVVFLIIFIGIQLLFIYYMIYDFIDEINPEARGSFYLIILSSIVLLDGIKAFIYTENAGLYVSLYSVFLILNILLLILLSLSGPRTKIKIPGFLLKLLDKNVNNITKPLNGNGNTFIEPTNGKSNIFTGPMNGNGITLYQKFGRGNKYYLTERECEVLEMIAKGLTSNEIGEELSLSKKTIDHHRANIKSKMGFSDTLRTVNFLEKNKYNNKNEE